MGEPRYLLNPKNYVEQKQKATGILKVQRKSPSIFSRATEGEKLNLWASDGTLDMVVTQYNDLCVLTASDEKGIPIKDECQPTPPMRR